MYRDDIKISWPQKQTIWMRSHTSCGLFQAAKAACPAGDLSRLYALVAALMVVMQVCQTTPLKMINHSKYLRSPWLSMIKPSLDQRTVAKPLTMKIQPTCEIASDAYHGVGFGKNWSM